MSFKRTIEDFRCEQCRNKVKGDGYTNHCPRCLWSKHVDIFPGDRAEPCGGLMKPARVEGCADDMKIVHWCGKCGTERRNKVSREDSADALVRLAVSA